jgi:hypothetical protein
MAANPLHAVITTRLPRKSHKILLEICHQRRISMNDAVKSIIEEYITDGMAEFAAWPECDHCSGKGGFENDPCVKCRGVGKVK